MPEDDESEQPASEKSARSATSAAAMARERVEFFLIISSPFSPALEGGEPWLLGGVINAK